MKPVPATALLDDDAARLHAWMVAHLDEMLYTLEALVRIESPTLDPDANHQVFYLLSALLEDQGFAIVPVAGRTSGGALFARPRSRPRGARHQLLLGHADTVWCHGTLDEIPFSVTDGRIRGPGTYDMKGGLVQMIFALRGLRELGLVPEVVPAVFINSDEEVGSSDSTRHISRLASCMDRCLILEPSLGAAGHLKTARKGVAQFLITVHGKASHAGLAPQDGISAILEISHIIQTLHALNERDITVNVGEITGGTRPNVVPARAAVVVDARVHTAEDADAIEARIRAITPTLPGATLEIEGGFLKRPMAFTPRNQRLWDAAKNAANRLGIPLDHGTAGGASDGNTTSLHAPTLDGLGAVGGGAHARHEFMWADKMAERAALLALLILSPPLS